MFFKLVFNDDYVNFTNIFYTQSELNKHNAQTMFHKKII